MAQDSTRRLLRVFGMAVTDLEDAVEELEGALAAAAPGRVAAAVAAHDRAAREAEARLGELEALLRGWSARARQAVAAHLGARGDS